LPISPAIDEPTGPNSRPTSSPAASPASTAAGADPVAAAFVLVVGRDIADRGVQADRVVLVADTGEIGAQDGGGADSFEVWPFGRT
jgi:hypothetical protein